MSQITELASSQINAGDAIVVELVEPASMPAMVRIVWPAKPTVCHTRELPGGSRGDHTAHRRIRYCPGTVEGARQVNQP